MQHMLSWIQSFLIAFNTIYLICISHFIFTSSKKKKTNSEIAKLSSVVYLTSKFTCISQTHARLLVKNSHVTLFHGHSSSILTHHVPRGVLPARVFIGSIRVSAATDLGTGRTTSTDTLTLNILTCNVTTKLAFTFNWYLSIYLFIFIFISFRRKRDKRIKIFHFDVDDCSVGLYIF